MEHPFRAEIVRADEARVVLAEPERPPARVRVRAWSDGTTDVRIRSNRPLVERVGWWGAAAAFGAATMAAPFVECGGVLGGGACLIVMGLLARWGMRASFGERVTVTPAALLRRRWLRRAAVFGRGEVSSVVVVGGGDEAHLEVQVGRERVPLADGLGYDEATLRWIAQRLRKAIEAAR